MARGRRRRSSGSKGLFAQGFSLAPVDTSANESPLLGFKLPPPRRILRPPVSQRLRVARAGVRSRATRHAWQA
jgi:hypothetical protein